MGNQLFQYACARSVALRNDSELVFDCRWFNASVHPTRPCQLNHFNITGKVGLLEELPRIPSRKRSFKFKKLLNLLGLGPGFVIERRTIEDEKILSLKSNCFLIGYFQSEKYFGEFENIIRQDLEMITPSTSRTREMSSKMSSENSVSLHICRGDYMAAHATTLNLSMSYYAKA